MSGGGGGGWGAKKCRAAGVEMGGKKVMGGGAPEVGWV